MLGAAGGWWYEHRAAAPSWNASGKKVAEYHAVYPRETRHLVEVPAEHMDDLTGWLGRRLNGR